MIGSDARKIDWKSSAKTGLPHVKLFYQEREAHITLCALITGSLLFGGKKETFLSTLAHLGYATIKEGHQLSSIMIETDQISTLPTTKKQHGVAHFIKKVSSVNYYAQNLSTTSLAKRLTPHLHKKSLIILVGDFLGEFELSHLTQRDAAVVFIIRDSFEEHPRPLGEGEFEDPQTEEKASFYFGKKAADSYKKHYHDNDQKLFKHLNALGIPYYKIVAKSATI
jgi:uncharacterized protein (DUF58 family)